MENNRKVKPRKSLIERAESHLTGKADLDEDIQVQELNLAMVATLRGKTRIHEDLSALHTKELIQELQRRKSELESQNSELLHIQNELEHSRNSLSDLYDHAPFGYFTLDRKGQIVEVNQTGCVLMAREKSSLAQEPFSSLVAQENQSDIQSHVQAIFETNKRQACELKIERPGKATIVVRLESISVSNEQGHYLYCRTACVDMTARRLTESNLKIYKEAFNHSIDCIATIDLNGVYIEQNAAHERLIGYSDEDIQGQTPLLHLQEDVLQEIITSLQANGFYRNEVQSRTKTGALLDIELAAFTVFDADGEPQCYVGIKRDITHRKKTEDTLKRSEEKWRSLVRHLPDRVITTETDGRITFVNHDLPGEFKRGLEPEFIMDCFCREHALLFEEQMYMVSDNGESVEFEVESLGNNGRSTWYSIRLGTFVKTDGPDGLVFVCTDLSAKHMIEEILKDSEQRYRTLVEGAQDAIVLSDVEGHHLYRNQAYAQLLGFESDADMEETGWDRVHPDDRTQLKNEILKIENNNHFTSQYRIRNRDGNWVTHRAHTTVIYDAEGNVESYLSVIRDDTELMNRESELKNQITYLQNLVRDKDRSVVRAQASLAEVTLEQHRSKAVIGQVAASLAECKGEDFFTHLVERVQIALEVDTVFVASRHRSSVGVANLLALKSILPMEPISFYDLTGTPCELVFQGGVHCYYPHSVSKLFPRDNFLSFLKAESYLALPLLNREGECLGIIGVIHGQEISDVDTAREILRIFASWAGVELERQLLIKDYETRLHSNRQDP